jgi:hypothetical protein
LILQDWQTLLLDKAYRYLCNRSARTKSVFKARSRRTLTQLSGCRVNFASWLVYMQKSIKRAMKTELLS